MKPLRIRIIISWMCAGLIGFFLFSDKAFSETAGKLFFAFTCLTYFTVRFWLKPSLPELTRLYTLTAYALIFLLIIILLFKSAFPDEAWLSFACWIPLASLAIVTIHRDIRAWKN